MNENNQEKVKTLPAKLKAKVANFIATGELIGTMLALVFSLSIIPIQRARRIQSRCHSEAAILTSLIVY